MGMSASQVRLLTVTKRIHEVENEAQRIQNQKMLLGLESDEAYEEYLAAMEMKNIEYAFFDPNQGNFDWANLTINSLFSNGYHLKVRQVATQYPASQTIVGESVTGANIATGYNGTSPLATGVQPIYGPTTANTVTQYNSANTGTTAQSFINLNTIYNNPSTPFLNPSTQVTGTATVFDNNLDFNNTQNFYIDNSNIVDFLNSIQTLPVEHNYEGKNIYLLSDITIPQGSSWSQLAEFKGTLDGCGHTINGLEQPLFRRINGATVKNLVINNSTVSSPLNEGGAIASSALGTVNIQNCAVTNSTITPTSVAGGFIGQVDSNGQVTFNHCYVDSNTTINPGNTVTTAGGFVGSIQSGDVLIANSYSVANTNGTYSGGFIGNASNSDSNVDVNNSYTTDSTFISTNSLSSNYYINSLALGAANAHQLTINYNANGTTGAVTVSVDGTDDLSSIAQKILAELNGSNGVNNNIFTITTDNNQLNITASNTTGYYNVTSVTDNDPSLINLADRLGLTTLQQNNSTTINNPNSFDGSISFDLNGNNTSVDISTCNTINDVLAAIQNKINTELSINTAKVELQNNQIQIFLPEINGTTPTIGTFASPNTQNWEAGGQSLVTILGLDALGIPAPDSYIIPGLPQDPDNEFHECATPAEVLQHLGSGVNLNDATVLRELIYNAYAIIMSEQLADDGVNHVWKETHVATNVGLREKEDHSRIARAEAEYEAALRRIDKKEEKYDADLAKMDQERSALTTQLDTFKTCIKDNIDRTFKVFS